MGTKQNPGNYDCYAKALPDEPLFILLARDEWAPVLVEDWAQKRYTDIMDNRRPKSDLAIVEEARQCAMQMRVWRKTHGDDAARRAAERWEYTAIGVAPSADVVLVLNNAGRDGWELVTKDGDHLILKRRVAPKG